MRIVRFEFHDVLLPCRRPFVTATSTVADRELIIVKAVTGEGAVGWGEVSADPDPGYAAETLGSARYVIEKYLAPALLAVELSGPDEVASRWRDFTGNEMAKSGLDLACWDAFARAASRPLAEVLGATARSVPVGVSIGIAPTVDGLLREIESALAEGARRIKVKIRPGWDVEPLRAARRRFGGIPLQADANSSYGVEHLDLLASLDEFGLTMLEQPLYHDDIVEHAGLQSRMRTPICLDESILCERHARAAIELGSCRVINVKLARVGGLAEARRIVLLCGSRGIPAWCGSMIESGVGAAFNLAFALSPGVTNPGDVIPPLRYFRRDIIRPPMEMSRDGTVSLPPGAGLGFEVDERALGELTLRRWTVP